MKTFEVRFKSSTYSDYKTGYVTAANITKALETAEQKLATRFGSVYSIVQEHDTNVVVAK